MTYGQNNFAIVSDRLLRTTASCSQAIMFVEVSFAWAAVPMAGEIIARVKFVLKAKELAP